MSQSFQGTRYAFRQNMSILLSQIFVNDVDQRFENARLVASLNHSAENLA